MKKLLLLLLLLITLPTAVHAQSGGSGTASSIYRSTFANLGSPVDGSVRYCTNCTPNTTPATSGGTGAFVDRVNGVWVARASAASGGGTVISVSVVTANGLSGTVSNPTTTPAITLNISALDAAKIADGSVSNAEFQRLDGVTSGIQAQFSGKVSGPASAVDNHLAVFDGTTGKLIKDGGTIPSGITNSAGANVLMKSDGTNAVASGATEVADVFTITEASDSLTVNGTTHTISVGAENSISFDAGGGTVATMDASGLNADNIVPRTGGGQVGSTANPFTSLAIGNAANNSSTISGTFTTNRTATLPDATGTIQLVGQAGLGTILPVDMSNGVLSTATGAVYSSPGTTAGLTAGTEGSVSFPIPRGGTIRNLYVRTGTTAKVNTPITVITIRKNGVDTAVTVTMAQTTSTTTSDTSNSFAVVAGDLITISFLTTGVAAVSTSIAGVSFELD